MYQFAEFDLEEDDEQEAPEPDLCEMDRYNLRNEAYDGVCLTPLRADGTCPNARSHA